MLGTWVPLSAAEDLAVRHSVIDRLRPIFEYTPGNESPPPAPRHASKPKAPKAKPPLPKWNSKTTAAMNRKAPAAGLASAPQVIEEYNNGDSMVIEEDIPDNLTTVSASYMAEDDRMEMSYTSTGHRKRKFDEFHMQHMIEQQHSLYGDELLDYFVLSRNESEPSKKPEPPPNFQPNWLVDGEHHTALHWAAAMGDVDVIRQMKRFNANPAARNVRGETPFMRATNFTNCFEKQTFPLVINELLDTAELRDAEGCTVIHHATIMKNSRMFSQGCARYYLDNILNLLQDRLEPSAFQALLNAQNNEGNTALHLAAKCQARKCIRSLLGRNAATYIFNGEGVRAEDLIQEINAMRRTRKHMQRSSSPFAPDSNRHTSFRDVFAEPQANPDGPAQASAAATTVLSRISPLVTDKLQDLAKSYNEEWQQKNVAEAEGLRMLENTTSELDAVNGKIAQLQSELESDEAGAKIVNEANRAKHQVLQHIAQQNRQHVQRAVEAELNSTNGEPAKEEPYAELLRLAQTLMDYLGEQKQLETDYVDALSMVGTGETVEKYRKLLKTCLMPEDGESLDANLDSVVDMVEEQRAADEMDGPGPDAEPMGICI